MEELDVVRFKFNSQERLLARCFNFVSLIAAVILIICGLIGLIIPFRWFFHTHPIPSDHKAWTFSTAACAVGFAGYLLATSTYNGIRLLQVTRKHYRYEYDRHKQNQTFRIVTNSFVLATLLLICIASLLQQVCPLSVYFTKSNRFTLWIVYNSIFVLPILVLLLLDEPTDLFKAYGRGTAQRYSIFQFTKLEEERREEHQLGSNMVRQKETFALLEK